MPDTEKENVFDIPKHVENLASWINPDQNVWHGHVLKLSIFGVGKINFRLPNGLDQIGIVQVQRIHKLRMVQPFIWPMLTKIQIHLVILSMNGLVSPKVHLMCSDLLYLILKREKLPKKISLTFRSATCRTFLFLQRQHWKSCLAVQQLLRRS